MKIKERFTEAKLKAKTYWEGHKGFVKGAAAGAVGTIVVAALYTLREGKPSEEELEHRRLEAEYPKYYSADKDGYGLEVLYSRTNGVMSFDEIAEDISNGNFHEIDVH